MIGGKAKNTPLAVKHLETEPGFDIEEEEKQ